MAEKYTIYDLETPANLFTAGFKDFVTGKRKNFVIHDSQNDLVDLIKFLRRIINHDYTLVGYNCLQFDGQIIQYLLNNYHKIKYWSGEMLAERIHELSQMIINLPQDEKWQQLLPEWKLDIPHIDIFKQCHYDSKNKRTSLKWLQFTMRFPNIESMPIHHKTRVGAESIPLVLGYMDNDVDSTAEAFKRMKFETDLRISLSAEYNLNLMNASEPRMAREIFGKFLSEQMGIPYRELKELRTYRNWIKAKDLIFPYIKFRDPALKEIHKFFLGLEFNPYEFEQNSYNIKKVKKNFLYDITGDVGLGGIHGCIEPGVYNATPDLFMEDIDATSFYPLIGISHGLFPEHLSTLYCKITSDIFDMRQKIDKEDPVNYIFKIILNSTYGLSKEPNNYFHDPAYTFAITINGQLLLLKLAELLKENVPDVKFFQFNTDGVTIGYHPKYKKKVEEVKNKWQKITRIPLENKFYRKVVIRDVNNYLAIDDKDGKVKRKGLFGYSLDPKDKEMYYHKNPSALIVPKALEAYFAYGIPYEKFIRDSKDIFDFCCGVKVKRDFNLVEYKYNPATIRIDKTLIKQQVVRYYISKESASLKKVYKPDSKMATKNVGGKATKQSINKKKETGVVELEKGWNTTYYNIHVHKPMKDYNINYDYYISEVKKVVDEIEGIGSQLKMEF